MAINFFGIVFLVSLIAESILTAALLSRPTEEKITRNLLLLLLGSIMVITFQELLLKTGFGHLVGPTYWLVMALWFAVAPLLFLFVKSLMNIRFQLARKHLWWFIIPFYLVLEWTINLLGNPFKIMHLMDYYWFILLWISFFLLQNIFFSTKAIWVMHHSDLPNLQQRKTRWLRWFLYALLAVHILSLTFFLFRFFTWNYDDVFESYQLSLYGIFILGIVFSMLQASPYFDQAHRAQYASSSLDDSSARKLGAAIKALMQKEKLFLDKKLNLTELAQRIEVPEYQLSQLFSQHLNNNFYDFVNAYRLLEFEEKIQDPSLNHLTIFGVAEECGFNSRANFYKVFKKKHKMTPSAFLKQQQA